MKNLRCIIKKNFKILKCLNDVLQYTFILYYNVYLNNDWILPFLQRDFGVGEGWAKLYGIIIFALIYIAWEVIFQRVEKKIVGNKANDDPKQ